MLYLTALSAALAAALVAYVLSLATPARAPRTMQDRMVEMGLKDSTDAVRQGVASAGVSSSSSSPWSERGSGRARSTTARSAPGSCTPDTGAPRR
jgi:hypothetical protein